MNEEPCHCGRPIADGRKAYCSERCKWEDTDHE